MVEKTRSERESTVKEGAQAAQEKAQQVARKTESRAKEMTSKAEHEAKTMLEQRKGQMASELNSVAQAFRETGGQLRQQDRTGVAQYSDRVADQVERFSGYLENKDVDAVVRDAENFARRQPELFLGAAFGAGLLVARFFKSSDQARQMGDGGRRMQTTSNYPARSPRSLPERDATPSIGNR